MSFLLGRLRQRAISQSTVGSRRSEDPPPLPSHSSPSHSPAEAVAGPLSRSQLALQESQQQQKTTETPVSRQIHPDINALFDSYASEPVSEPNPGLRPPRPRKRSKVLVVSKTPERTTPRHSRSGSSTRDNDNLQELPSRLSFAGGRVSTNTRESEDTAEGSSRRLSQLARFPQHFGTPVRWSTFGKPKGKGPRLARFTPPASTRQSVDYSVQQRPSSRKTQRSSHSISRAGSSVSVPYRKTESRLSSVIYPPESPTSSKSSSSPRYAEEQAEQPPPSPPLTVSSRHNSIIYTATQSSSVSSPTNPMNTPSSIDEFHSFIVDSPGTFGEGTPRHSISDEFHLAPRPTSVPPPLPSPRHPELIRSLSTRPGPSTSTQAASDMHAFPRISSRGESSRGQTYPLRQRIEQVFKGDENTPITNTDRPLRTSTSLARIQEIFPPYSPPRRKSRSASRKRRSHSTSSRRRRSAEWVAQQAASGVTSENIHEYGWPAEVSRAMVRLSLGEMAGGDAGLVTERGRTPRGMHASAPGAVASRSEPCIPPNLPSPPPPPSRSFTSPPIPSGTLQTRAVQTQRSSESQLAAIETGFGASEQSEFVPRGGSLIRSGSEVEGEGDTGTRTTTTIMMTTPVAVERSQSHRISSRMASSSGGDSETTRPSEVATIPRSASGTRSPRRSILNNPNRNPSSQSEAGPSTPGLLAPRSPAGWPKRSSSEPGLKSVLETPTNSKGKRKADEVDITPPDQKVEQRATFVIPENGRRTQLVSESAQAPSAYQHRKRVRLSTPSPAATPSHSRPGTHQTASESSTSPSPWPFRTTTNNHPPSTPSRAATTSSITRAASTRSAAQVRPPGSPTPSAGTLLRSHSQHAPSHAPSSLTRSLRRTLTPNNPNSTPNARDRRRSLSEMSIPISALIMPHAPSITRSTGTYHYRMRDPGRPPPVRPTSWTLHLRSEFEDPSPFHAWAFFVGFVLFPVWWVASGVGIPRTRRLGVGGTGADVEKAVTLDDPQVEHDARSWRFRCRIMSAVSLVTYIPFIVLIAIFVPK